MKTHLSIPQVALIAGTRVALGVGIGLLIADRLTADQRKSTGLVLFALGVATTIPLAIDMFSNRDAMNVKMLKGD